MFREPATIASKLLDLPYVKRMTVVFGTSGAITFVKFCANIVRVLGNTEIMNACFGQEPSTGNEGFGLGSSSVSASETIAYMNYRYNGKGSKSSKSSKHNYVRQLKDADDVLDSTKTAKGCRLSTNKMSRYYTQGGQMYPST